MISFLIVGKLVLICTDGNFRCPMKPCPMKPCQEKTLTRKAGEELDTKCRYQIKQPDILPYLRLQVNENLTFSDF
jgi:hypothetical protein